MAHRRIKISRAPWIKEDGTVSTKKTKFRVTCRSQGKVCYQSSPVKGYSAAEILVDTHRDQHVAEHFDRHPNDVRFFETLRGKRAGTDSGNIAEPTTKQKPSRPTYDMGGAADYVRGIASRVLSKNREN